MSLENNSLFSSSLRAKKYVLVLKDAQGRVSYENIFYNKFILN